MKKKTIVWIIFFLSAILLFSACGTEPEAVVEETPAPTEEPDPMIELPGSVIGTWISLNDPEDVLVFTGDGTLSANGTDIELTGLSENGILYRWGETDGIISVVHGYLSCVSPLPLSEKSSSAFFYKQGEENPAARFIGSWTLCTGEGSVRNGAAVEEFTITGDGEVLMGEESIPAFFQMIFDSDQNIEWMLRADGDAFWCSFFSDEPDALDLETGQGWGRYYKDVKVAELSPGNWRDFFDVSLYHSMGHDDQGNPRNSIAQLFLVGKDGLEILCVKDGKATVTSSPKSYAMLLYDTESGGIDFRAISPKERWKYNTNYFINNRKLNANEVFRQYGDGVYADEDTDSFRGWGLCVVMFSDNTLIRDGNILASPTITDYYWSVSKISGTVYYRETE